MAGWDKPILLATILLATAGCGDSPAPSAVPAADPPSLSAAGVRAVGQGSAAADAPPANNPPSPARQLVQRVLDRYRRAAYYRDDGVVRLAYRQSGVPQIDEAPLQVRYESAGRVRLTAYTLDLACDAGRLSACIAGPSADDLPAGDSPAGGLDRQVLRRSIAAGRPPLAELYADPAVVHFSSAGLGGPSPQLELLLSPQPLAGLLDGKTELRLGSPEKIDGALCDAVVIDAMALRYVIWVDREALLVRRIELPLAGVPGMLADDAIEDATLTIELTGAAFQRDPQETYRIAAPPDALPVRRFVPQPPPLASELIGRHPADFQLRSADRSVAVSQQGAGGTATVLLWVADHEGSKLAAGQLQAVADGLPERLRRNTQWLIVMAEPIRGASSQDATGRLLRDWQVGLPWTDDTQAVGRDVFRIRETPAVCVLSPQGQVQWFSPRAGPQLATVLPGLLGQIAAGVDVGGAIRARYEQAQRAYQEQLQASRW